MEINLLKSENNNKEILEMILQFLDENKLYDSEKLLAEKANIIFDQKEIQQLKDFLRDHKFDEAILFLEKSQLENLQKFEVLKLIKSRKYIELVKEGKKEIALQFLRNEISQIYSDQKILNKYTVLLFQSNSNDFEKHLNQNFSEINNDEIILNKIQSLLCLSIDSNGNRILPNSRLENLLEYYMEQMKNGSFESEQQETTSNLLTVNNKRHLSFNQQKIIEKHDDEVWLIEFTLNNKYFVTCSRNGSICVFKTQFGPQEVIIEFLNSFSAHRKYITSMKWSNTENNLLLTSSADKQIKLWNAIEGKCLKTFLIHLDIVTSVLWLSNDTFISGSIDKKMLVSTISNLNYLSSNNSVNSNITSPNITSKIICSETFLRVRALLLSSFLNCVIIIPASMNDIIFYNYKEFREVHRFSEPDPINSANLSKSDDGRYMITNVSIVNASINLYDLSTFALTNKYYGHTQDQYIIKCSFAGSKDEYIICGSEDASIYLWHRSHSIPIHIVKGHTGSLNCVEWIINENSSVLFSVSDDHTIRVWTDNSVEIKFEDSTSKDSETKKKFYKENEYPTNSNINYMSIVDSEMSENSNSENDNIDAQNSESEENS